jgi:hypothetical protein
MFKMHSENYRKLITYYTCEKCKSCPETHQESTKPLKYKNLEVNIVNIMESDLPNIIYKFSTDVLQQLSAFMPQDFMWPFFTVNSRRPEQKTKNSYGFNT